MIVGVPSKDVTGIWPIASRFIQMALDKRNTTITLDYIYDRLLAAHMQIWMVYDGCGAVAAVYTTCISGRVCSVVTMGGENMNDWVGDAMESVKDFARHSGCTSLEMEGRRGWRKKLNRIGWKESATIMIMEI